jgi:hypothetical protein
LSAPTASTGAINDEETKTNESEEEPADSMELNELLITKGAGRPDAEIVVQVPGAVEEPAEEATGSGINNSLKVEEDMETVTVFKKCAIFRENDRQSTYRL